MNRNKNPKHLIAMGIEEFLYWILCVISLGSVWLVRILLTRAIVEAQRQENTK